MTQRINAYLARALGRSRRSCDDLIACGRVTVAGRAALPNDRVDDSVVVLFDGKPLHAPAQNYVAFNKPAGYLTARRDERDKTVHELLPSRYKNLFPVGRLDKDTRGLLLFTNDGDWAQKLLHPSHEIVKRYRVELNRVPSLDMIRSRVQLHDGPSLFDSVEPVDIKDKHVVEVTLHEGRKRQIRRHMRELGYRILDLVRTEIGGILLGDLPEGSLRALSRDEIGSITRSDRRAGGKKDRGGSRKAKR